MEKHHYLQYQSSCPSKQSIMSANSRYVSQKSIDSTETDENSIEIFDVLPLWKLALHAEGAPLILPNVSPKSCNAFSNNYLCEKFKSNSKELFKINTFEANNAKRSSECLFKGNDLFLSHRINRRSYGAQNKSCLNPDKQTIVSVSLKSEEYNCNSDDVSICSSESSISVDEVTKRSGFTPKQNSKPLLKICCSDSQSMTSEDSSSASDHCLPRVIKPRKRRKKNKYFNQVMVSSSDWCIKSQINFNERSVVTALEQPFANQSSNSMEKFDLKCKKLEKSNIS